MTSAIAVPALKKIYFCLTEGCNLSCRHCWIAPEFDAQAKQYPTLPVDLFEDILIEAQPLGLQAVKLTGGEPLLHKEFLKKFIPLVKEELGLKAYLETNGTLPANLKEVIDLIDIVAMDFKLPSSTGEKGFWEEHKESLLIAKEKNCFVKIVITSETKDTDVRDAIDIVHAVDKDMLLVLQPVSPIRQIERPRNKALFDYLFQAEKKLEYVRIMPQMQKILKER